MLPHTHNLRREIQATEGNRERLEILRNAYSGTTAWMLSCGPSLADVTPSQFAERSGCMVMAVKQAIDWAPDADLHCYNGGNLWRGKYADPPPIRVATVRYQLAGDIVIPFVRPVQVGHWEHCVAITGDIQGCQFERTFERPWGPSIAFDLAFPLLVWTGVSRIVTLGLDLTGEAHAYGGSPYSAAGREEMAVAASGVPAWYKWLTSHGIEWEWIDTGRLSALRGIVPAYQLSSGNPT